MALPIVQRRGLLALALLLALLLVPHTQHYATAEPYAAQPAQVALQPFLNIIPSDDGLSVFVTARGVNNLGSSVFTNMRIGPTGHKGSYTMTPAANEPAFAVSVSGFAPSQAITGTISISTSVGLDSGELEFVRGYVPADTPAVVVATGQAQLSLPNANSFDDAVYLVAAPSFAPPGPPPAGMQIIGHSYSLAASGQNLRSTRPMSLRLGFSAPQLGATDPQDLAIYAWDETAGWQRLGGTVFAAQGYVAVSTDRLTSYALMAGLPYAVYLPLSVR